MVKLSLCFQDVENSEETTVCVKKGVFDLEYLQGLLFEKSKQAYKFTTSKNRVRKYSKFKVVINFD